MLATCAKARGAALAAVGLLLLGASAGDARSLPSASVAGPRVRTVSVGTVTVRVRISARSRALVYEARRSSLVAKTPKLRTFRLVKTVRSHSLKLRLPKPGTYYVYLRARD